MTHSGLTAGIRHELGGYREHRPVLELARFAESLWTHRTPVEAAPGRGMHRVLPDPSLNLAFCCGREPDGRATDPRLAVIGPKTRPFLFRFQPGHEIVAVKVKLEWARPLLGLDPAEHLDRENDVAGLVRHGRELLAALSATRKGDDALVLLAEAVIDVGRQRGTTPSRVSANALDLVRQTRGRVKIEALADHMGVSLRQLRRQVRAEASVPLKTYARITRLNHAVRMADRSARPAWARLAAEAGFCDQSHLVRECRALAGLAPRRTHRERLAQAELSNPG